MPKNVFLTSILFLSSLSMPLTLSAEGVLPGGGQTGGTGGPGDPMSDIRDYLTNLGKYFGYDVTNYCSEDGPCPQTGSEGSSGASAGSSGQTGGGDSGSASFSHKLLDIDSTQLAQANIYNSFIGSLVGGAENPLLPQEFETAKLFQQNSALIYPSYNSGGSSAVISASPTVDQKSKEGGFQSNPVRQAILNVLSTPDVSYCANEKKGADICNVLTRQQILGSQWTEDSTKSQPLDLYCISPSLIPQPRDWDINHKITGFLSVPTKKQETNIPNKDDQDLIDWLKQNLISINA